MGPDDLGRLLDDHAGALVLYARQWSPVPEDIVQEAFVKLVAQRPTPLDPAAWLYRVVRNQAISAARSARRRQRHEMVAAAQAPLWFQPEDTTGLDVEMVTAALEGLPADQREVIVAHIWGGRTFAQIGALTGSSASTAHRWYLQGLTTLRERLGVACPTKSFPES